MNITYFDPSSRSGQKGYINYKMSGGRSSGGGGRLGCGIWFWIFIILLIIEIIKIFS